MRSGPAGGGNARARPWSRAALAPWMALGALLGCGEDESRTPGGDSDTSGLLFEPPILALTNHSQFELLALYLHRGAQRAGEPDRLAGPMAVGERLVIDPFEAGWWYITVVREKVAGGELIAISSAAPFSLSGNLYTQLRYELWVFDDRFRVFDPVDNGTCHYCAEGGPLDGGPDGGPPGGDEAPGDPAPGEEDWAAGDALDGDGLAGDGLAGDTEP